MQDNPRSKTMGPLKSKELSESLSAEATLANIRNSFWIPSARNVVRKILRTCITCRKISAKGSQQLIADLPAARVTACTVFSQVGSLRLLRTTTPGTSIQFIDHTDRTLVLTVIPSPTSSLSNLYLYKIQKSDISWGIRVSLSIGEDVIH
ncbi:hypothetical protein TNCT_282691 [Trichonephila clavata]|uniref:Integrase zinc-binding domain-containing protein n=1 Tax=Trichonephila clavata TaxID=2740835 RepID=A0A8X6FK56_TRICU|nr:hypothetical protein TNCT_282691 [Trichonephila clavata]